jgi:hypothetical protein
MLNNLNVDSLKVLVRKLNLPKILTRRDELMAALDKELRSNLPGIVERLSETEHKALAQAVHNGGTIARESFKAMYGVDIPDLEPWAYHKRNASLLLMFGEYLAGCFVVSEALRKSLQGIIPEPARPAVSVVDAVPEIYQPAKTGWRKPTPRPVRIFASAEIAPLELRSVLQLVRSGKLFVTDKSLRPGGPRFRRRDSSDGFRIASSRSGRKLSGARLGRSNSAMRLGKTSPRHPCLH